MSWERDKNIHMSPLCCRTYTSKEVEKIHILKSDIIESLQTDINTAVDKRTRELEDRKCRESYPTIFNLKEHSDEEDIRTISANVCLDKPAIVSLFRLGKTDQS